MTKFECIQETLQDLQEDAALIRMTLLGALNCGDNLTLTCLLRLSNYLDQHVHDLFVLAKK